VSNLSLLQLVFYLEAVQGFQHILEAYVSTCVFTDF
jgi:hypothetical protein